MGWFRRRKDRESAIPSSETLGSFASDEGQPVVGRQIGGGAPVAPGMLESIQSLAALGPMIQQAMAQGNVEGRQDAAQTIDMRGTELGDEIRSIMKQHGIDPEGGAGGPIDASAMPAMQQQILEALGRHGIDANASGSSVQFGVGEDDEK